MRPGHRECDLTVLYQKKKGLQVTLISLHRWHYKGHYNDLVIPLLMPGRRRLSILSSFDMEKSGQRSVSLISTIHLIIYSVLRWMVTDYCTEYWLHIIIFVARIMSTSGNLTRAIVISVEYLSDFVYIEY